MNAPEFPADTRWINTTSPVTLASLRGRVVVMDFWTYCCINCLHALPRLAALEQSYADQPVTVLGVHSGKFAQEHNDEKVRQAIDKYDIRHPVAMDDEFVIWNLWGARAWPTLVVLDSTGKVSKVMTGEPEPGQLESIVDQLLAEGKRNGSLRDGEGPELVAEASTTNVLDFPGKILVADERLFVADTGHHRVIVSDLNGNARQVFGGKEQGFVDGDAGRARFYEPQGMALVGDKLYVADRNNHAIRLIDLQSNKVSTVAGTGRKGTGRSSGGGALTTDLRSPWALAWRDGGLDIAMAGSHQIWRYTPVNKQVRVLAGSGAEAIVNGTLGGSAFAQPSGLWWSGKLLYVADSETSSVRAIDIEKNQVRTLVGTGLFDFGFADGEGLRAKLQHPLGITGVGDLLYVADSFNNALRVIDTLRNDLVKTIKFSGVSPLNEPSGVSLAGDKLYVADTNNHRIVIIDVKSKTGEVLDIHLPTR